MDKYIYLDSLLGYPIRSSNYDREHGNEHFIYGIESVMEYAESLPVINIVRCGHCKYYRRNSIDEPWYGMCYLHTEPYDNKKGYRGEAVCVDADDFCSYGEASESPSEPHSEED